MSSKEPKICTVCSKANKQAVLTCSFCHSFQHPVCIGVSFETREKIDKEVWRCQNCKICQFCSTEKNLTICNGCQVAICKRCEATGAKCGKCDLVVPKVEHPVDNSMYITLSGRKSAVSPQKAVVVAATPKPKRDSPKKYFCIINILDL